VQAAVPGTDGGDRDVDRPAGQGLAEVVGHAEAGAQPQAVRHEFREGREHPGSGELGGAAEVNRVRERVGLLDEGERRELVERAGDS
jgi:hypothetical protein